MIDVTFLLLIYFMVTTVLAKPEDRLSPTLQTQQPVTADQASDFQPQIVEVVLLDGQPAYRLGGSVFRTRGELSEALSALPVSVGVVIQVVDPVPVGVAVGAFQAARDAGFEQVTYVPGK